MDGRVLEREQDDARGTPMLPFSQDELVAKFRRLAGSVLPEEQVENVVRKVARLEQLPSIAQLVPLLLRS